jgi:hypothetical protein
MYRGNFLEVLLIPNSAGDRRRHARERYGERAGRINRNVDRATCACAAECSDVRRGHDVRHAGDNCHAAGNLLELYRIERDVRGGGSGKGEEPCPGESVHGGVDVAEGPVAAALRGWCRRDIQQHQLRRTDILEVGIADRATQHAAHANGERVHVLHLRAADDVPLHAQETSIAAAAPLVAPKMLHASTLHRFVVRICPYAAGLQENELVLLSDRRRACVAVPTADPAAFQEEAVIAD